MTKEIGEPAPASVRLIVADPPIVTGMVTPLVGERVKDWLVGFTVRLTVALTTVLPLVPATVIACTPEGNAMLAAVVMVKVTF